MKRYFQRGTGSGRWGRTGSLIPSPARSETSHSVCHEAAKELPGVWRSSPGSQEHRVRGPGLWAESTDATPEEEPQKCLNLSPFLALLTSDLRAFGFLLWSPSPPFCPSVGVERAFAAELSPERPTLSPPSLQRQFHGECQVKHLWGIFSMYFIKLYM